MGQTGPTLLRGQGEGPGLNYQRAWRSKVRIKASSQGRRADKHFDGSQLPGERGTTANSNSCFITNEAGKGRGRSNDKKKRMEGAASHL